MRGKITSERGTNLRTITCNICGKSEQVVRKSLTAATRIFHNGGWSKRGKPQMWVCQNCQPEKHRHNRGL